MTVATAERSFSKLKLIKIYLRSKISQERLDNLAILSIEMRKPNQLIRLNSFNDSQMSMLGDIKELACKTEITSFYVKTSNDFVFMTFFKHL